MKNVFFYNTRLMPYLFRGYDSWAIGSDETRFVLSEQPVLDPDHVLLGDALSDAHYEAHLRIHGLQDGLRGTGGRHVDNSGIGACHRQ